MKIPLITKGIIPLWHSGYYDGPMSGVLEYNGERCYFDLKKEYQSRNLFKKVFRTFNIYKMTPKQNASISYWHEEFCLHVGTHSCYFWSEKTKRYTRNVSFSGDMDYCKEMFYERYEKDVIENGSVYATLHKSQIIGWCTYDILLGMPQKEWRKKK